MRSIARLANAALLAAALVAGCSSNNNSSDGSTTGPGGFDPTTRLVDLTPAQMMQVCKQQAPNGGSGLVSCGADASVYVTPIGVCTSIQDSACSATVATSQTCANALAAAACDPKATAAAMKTPECLVMVECAGALCGSSMCFCADYSMLNTCEVTCRNVLKGLTTSCASCIAGLYNANMCPDFTMQGDGDVPANCASACASTNAGG